MEMVGKQTYYFCACVWLANKYCLLVCLENDINLNRLSMEREVYWIGDWLLGISFINLFLLG